MASWKRAVGSAALAAVALAAVCLVSLSEEQAKESNGGLGDAMQAALSLPKASSRRQSEGMSPQEERELEEEEAGEHSGNFLVHVYGKHAGLYPELKPAHNMAVIKAHGSMSVKAFKAKLAKLSNLHPKEMLLENPQDAKDHADVQPLAPDFRTLASCGVPGNKPEWWSDSTLSLTVRANKKLKGADEVRRGFMQLNNVEEITPSALQMMHPGLASSVGNAIKITQQMRRMGKIKDAQDMELKALTAANSVLTQTSQAVDWNAIHHEYYSQLQNSQIEGQMEAMQERFKASAKASGGHMSLEDVMEASGGELGKAVGRQYIQQDKWAKAKRMALLHPEQVKLHRAGEAKALLRHKVAAKKSSKAAAADEAEAGKFGLVPGRDY